ncbi:MAG: LysR substrate-binding domain-containing protein [Pseudomonadota bacterium]
MTPSLRGLRVFCEAARHRSFKTASESLFITASAVSHQVRSLETELGCELFVRQTRSLALTPQGEALFEQIDPLLTEVSAVCVSLFGRESPTVLRLAAPPFFATERLLPHLPRLVDSASGYALDVATMDGQPDRHPDNADIAVLLADQTPALYPTVKLFALTLVPACAPSIAHRLRTLSVADWVNETLLVHQSRANAWRRFFESQRLRLRAPTRVVQLDSMHAVVKAAEQGLGIALVPEALAQHWFRQKRLVQLCTGGLPTGDAYYLSARPRPSDGTNFDSVVTSLSAALA